MSLPMDATKEDIKKQYRRLCLQWHPDKSDGGRERFEQLQVAHRFLTETMHKERNMTLAFGQIDLPDITPRSVTR